MKLFSDLPLYESIRRELRSKIENGELAVGMRILPEIELAKQIGVSRSTARKALQALEVEGLITRTAGRGSFVSRPQMQDNTVHSKGTLAITVNNIERFNHAGQIVQGFMNSSTMNGFRASIHPPNAGMDEFDYLLSVRRSGIDGWALWLSNANDKITSLLRNFQKAGAALVLVDRYVRDLECDAVVTKNTEMAHVLTRELIK